MNKACNVKRDALWYASWVSLALAYHGALGCGEAIESSPLRNRDAATFGAPGDGAGDAARDGGQHGSDDGDDDDDDDDVDGDGGDSGEGSCLELPTPKRAAGTVVDLRTDILLSDRPLLIGEPNALAPGLAITPLDLRFYVSRVALRTRDGRDLPVDLVSEAGVAEPYGVHLVNADDPGSRMLHVLAPAGSYAGVVFTLGIGDACNAGSIDRKPPLGTASQMTWPHTGYLFLRYQAALARDPSVNDASTGDTGAPIALPPMVIHMGGQVGALFAPVVVAIGNLAVPSSGRGAARLRLHLDKVLEGAAAPVDLSGFVGPPGDEVLAGERLRQTAPGLALFDVAPP